MLILYVTEDVPTYGTQRGQNGAQGGPQSELLGKFLLMFFRMRKKVLLKGCLRCFLGSAEQREPRFRPWTT